MSRIRVDVWVTPETYIKLMRLKAEKSFKNYSQTVVSIITEYYRSEERVTVAINNLNKVIQKQYQEIEQLKSEIAHLNIKIKEKNKKKRSKK